MRVRNFIDLLVGAGGIFAFDFHWYLPFSLFLAQASIGMSGGIAIRLMFSP